MTELLLVLILLAVLAVYHQDRKTSQTIVNAILARTPAEFELLQREGKKVKRNPSSIPPIGL